MYLSTWHIGLDIHDHHIRALAATKRRDGWQLRHCWQLSLAQDALLQDTLLRERISGERLQDSERLKPILVQWRNLLPRKIKLRLALPVQQTLQKQLALPQHTTLREPELGWFVHANAEKQFPATDLALDYRVYGQQICVSATRQKDLNFWLDLLAEIGLFPDAVDISPCALRYVAQFAAIPDDSWLIHKRTTDWLWVAPTHLPFSYGLLSTQSYPCLTQVINQLPTTPGMASRIIYCSDENNSDEKNGYEQNSDEKNSREQSFAFSLDQPQIQPEASIHFWHMLSAFRHYQPPLPEATDTFMIAAGLALRPDDQ
ncbi:MAG: pilus assembly protein PilM [Enterobacteriaceae bacterium]|jgi:pilus assembly protein HofM|nr:pilus assembly protein PilM [Enterobacteriaceae bacterium]